MKELFSIEGKTALITGGSRGIGLMMARAYVRSGAKVYISSRKSDVCNQVAEELSKEGTCIALPADITGDDGLNALVEQLKLKEQKLDVLINNAGKGWEAPLESFPDRGWDDVMNVNVKAIFKLTRALLPQLEAAGGHGSPARVINIGSIAAETSNAMNLYSYGASKSAIHWLTKALAREFGTRHITVNAIAPGRFPSAMTAPVMADKERYDAEVSMIPLRRWGEENDIAGLSVFLASPAAAFITGVIIPLDGGTRLA
jgi:NAD(P)-dependent dehydrogenase (short-subunit alcohol dehydrogenase family)